MTGSSATKGRQRRCLSAQLGLVAAALGVILALAIPSGAGAKPLIGKDGRIHACYRVKGKPKGALRAVKGAKTRCRKGERRVSWVAAGATGAGGSPGSPGQPGGQGAEGTPATGALETRVAELTKRVEALEKTLAGVTNAQLLGLIADVNALCSQTSALTGQLNSVTAALGGVELVGVIPLGLELLVPGLPSALSGFACP